MSKKLYFFEGAITNEYIYKALHDLGLTRYNSSENEFYSQFVVIDNDRGYKNALNKLKKSDTQIVFSNCVYLLGQDCFFNEGKNEWDIYIWKGRKHFVKIQDLTERELRYAHNIEKMYKGGEFDD